MSLFKKWQDKAYTEKTQEEYDLFWNEYLPMEQNVYVDILNNKDIVIEGTVSELAKKYDMDNVTLVGFLDGINSSLKEEIDLDSLIGDSPVKLTVDFEKLFYNMHEAQAKWLYELKEWEPVLDLKTRKEIKKAYNDSKIVKSTKVGRNEPCPCGSGKKYKKCCLNKEQ